MNYKSVIGFGKISVIESFEEKSRGFGIIMAHYSKDNERFKSFGSNIITDIPDKMID